MDYQHDRQSVHLIVYHLIFYPKRRRRVLVGPIQQRLEQIIDEVIMENGWHLIQRAIQPDHVQRFVRTDPSTLPSDIPRVIKGRSSRLLRQEFAHVRNLSALWSPSCFLSTAGNVSSETIEHAICNNKAETKMISLPLMPQ